MSSQCDVAPGIYRLSSASLIGIDRLPTELWIQVLDHLPPVDLRTFSSTCRELRELARPLLYTTFSVSIVAFVEHHPGLAERVRFHLPRSLVDHMERMQFYASPSVAPFVKDCELSLCGSIEKDCGEERPHDEAKKLMEWFFFMVVDKFPALKSMTLRGVTLTSHYLSHIKRLQVANVESLTLEGCPLDGWPSVPRLLPKLSIPSITLLDKRLPCSALRNTTFQDYLSFIDIRALRTLHMHAESPLYMDNILIQTYLFVATLPCNQTFVSLTVLHLPYHFTGHPLFIPFLEKCPNLEELGFLEFDMSSECPPGFCENRISQSILPHVTRFIGPYPCLVPFLGFQLRSIVLTGTYVRTDAAHIGCLLLQLEYPEMLEVLHVSMTPCESQELFLDIECLFPKLEFLAVASLDSTIGICEFAGIPNLLPPTIQDFRLGLQQPYYPDDREILMRGLLERCQGMRTVVVNYEDGRSWTWGSC
ncbi:hypothetical protein JAAARDRAFT_72702 [Jaapia argillacea MUCL 33604]|uniref:F-box domain-containing protein n=1 Tax=Jaapia argillacea MUCL 33604 TaxID=933084 RepID=A0A067PE52_9AGAM|nr:hypothetical protein JAAARDRAFT_72702 [Jaapia argillacea MUCL 33604]